MNCSRLRNWALGAVAVCLWPIAAAHAQTSGSIVAWGDNRYGQCDVPDQSTDFVAVACGTYFSLGLKSDGCIVAWGQNHQGQCDVPEPNSEFIAIAAGNLHSLGLHSDGSIVAWGYNDYGQCQVPSPNEDFVAIAAGGYHSLGLKSDGSIVAWGHNNYGQCNVPGSGGFVAISAGDWHSIALDGSPGYEGSITAWGDNGSGQCSLPKPNTGFTAIAAASAANIALRPDGSTLVFGGSKKQAYPNEGFTAIAASGRLYMGLKSDGSVAQWWDGLCAFPDCVMPSPNTDFVAIARGKRHSLGIRVVDNPPTADAGPSQVGYVGFPVSLDGSASSDDNTPSEELIYEWWIGRQPSGSAAVIDDPAAQIATFTPDVPGDYRVGLFVYDNIGQKSKQDKLPVTVILDERPVANAGEDHPAYAGEPVTLDGSGSWDDSTASADLVYEWAFIDWPSGSAAEIADPTAQLATFTPDLGGMYTVQLIVYDWLAQPSDPDTVVINAIVDDPPTAVAGEDQELHAGQTVFLDGSASFDDNTPSELLEFGWSFVEKPTDSAAILVNGDLPWAWFDADVPGTFIVQLVVTDERGQPSTDELIVSSVNLAPTADAGEDVVTVYGWVVPLSGAGSSDPEEDELTCQWTLVSVPEGSLASIAGETSMDCTLQTDLPGDYVVQLVVSDPFGPSAPDEVVVTAITGEEFVENVAHNTRDLVLSLPSDDITTAGNQEALGNFLTEVIRFVQQDKPRQAIKKLEDCIERTDGCVLRGSPDANGPGRDWIVNCDVQQQVYAELMLALEAIEE